MFALQMSRFKPFTLLSLPHTLLLRNRIPRGTNFAGATRDCCSRHVAIVAIATIHGGTAGDL